jgi:hypothetical protein
VSDGAFDLMLDCYRSWEAYIALCRERFEADGEYPSVGPWRQRDASDKTLREPNESAA